MAKCHIQYSFESLTYRRLKNQVNANINTPLGQAEIVPYTRFSGVDYAKQEADRMADDHQC